MNIAVDIGGSKILVAASTERNVFLRKAKIETPETGAQGITEIIHLIEKVAEGESISAIMVASAGPLDRRKGIILGTSPNMHGWRNTNLVDPLKSHFKVPVGLELDTVAAALTESEIGAGKDKQNVLYVTISTGIGAALVVNGQPYNGDWGIEAGHMIIDPDGPDCGCGGKGHFEAMVSGRAIKETYGKFGYEITDPKIWDEIAGTMALGFHNLITMYSPGVVVIGGGVGVHYDKFHDFLLTHLKRLSPMYPLPPIAKGDYIETAVAYGALILAERLH